MTLIGNFRLLILLLIGYSAYAQPIALQHVLFKEPVVASQLTAFLDFTKAKVVSLHIGRHRYGSMQYINGSTQLVPGPPEEGPPIYKVEEEPDYLEYLERQRPSAWAEWQGHIVLLRLSDQIEPDHIYTLLNPSGANNLVKYARRILSKQVVPPQPVEKPAKGKSRDVRASPPPPFFDGVFWEFKVIDGAAVFLNGNHTPH